MSDPAALQDREAALLRRAVNTYLHPTRVEMKHAQKLMRRGLLDPTEGNPFKASTFVISVEGRIALASHDEEKRAHNAKANAAVFITTALRFFDDYALTQEGDRKEVCDVVLNGLRALEIPFRK